MTKEELQAKRAVALSKLKDIEVALCLDEHYIDIIEKENEELRNNGFTVSAMTEQQLKVALEKGERLEKENAELKKKIGIYQKGMYDEIEKRDRKLTKATEIIREIMKYDIPTLDYEKAEQFLKDIKK